MYHDWRMEFHQRCSHLWHCSKYQICYSLERNLAINSIVVGLIVVIPGILVLLELSEKNCLLVS